MGVVRREKATGEIRRCDGRVNERFGDYILSFPQELAPLDGVFDAATYVKSRIRKGCA